MAYAHDPEVFDRSLALYLKGEILAAYDLLTKEAANYPDHEQRIYEWRLDMAAKMGKLELAEEILEDALDSGFFYGEFALRKDDDVQVLQGRPFFESLVQRSFQMLADAQAYSRPRLVILNRGQAIDGKVPLFLALHGNNSTADKFKIYWRSLVNKEWLVALPQSSQVGGKDIYVWNNMDTVEKELTEHYRTLSSEYAVDPMKTIISGFSKGGHAAIVAALKQQFAMKGFIAIAPYIPNLEDLIALLDTSSQRNLHGYMLLGEEDHECTPGALQLHQEFTKRGFQCKVEVFPGLGHEFPHDFDQILPRAVDFVLGR